MPPTPVDATLRGSAEHHEALAVARRHSLGPWRSGGLDAFHRFKLRFFLRQPAFPLRVLNFLLYRLENQRVAKVHYAPVEAQIDANGGCELRCPSCVVGRRLPSGSRLGRARLATMKAIVDQTCRRSFQIGFHFHGEPLLNPDFFPACDYAARRGLWTVIHSNLNPQLPELAERMVAARLGNLVVSCDGATQEIYEQYRRGGDVERVFANLSSIAEQKRRTGSSFPWITAKFIVFEHNWHEMKAFEDHALAAGANDVIFVTGFRHSIYETGRAASDEEFDLETLRWQPRRLPATCPHVWYWLKHDYDGGVLPCGYAHGDEHLFVSPKDGLASTVVQQWNQDRFVAVREFFLERPGVTRDDLPAPCSTCEYTRREA